MLKNNFTSSEEVFDWLSGFINLERGQKPKSFRIDRMHALCELAGNPHRCAPSIHIAGSKGKGSVTSMLAAMLTAAGFKAARYMSPHVSDFRERVCMGGSFFDEEVYRAAGGELKHIVEVLLPAAKNELFIAEPPGSLPEHLRSKWSGCEPTYWELLTLFFFLCARYAQCDVMVVETGLGGRLDSTNVIDPLISVITLIELEHTNFLGNTIAEIAGEKAGIIKQCKPVIIAKQCDEALEVFKKTAKEKNSPLFYLPEISELSDINVTSNGTSFSLSNNLFSFMSSVPPCEILNLKIPIPGKVQAENAALAIAALKIAFNKSLFQNSVSFGKGFRKSVLKGAFSFKSKVAFPKTEVLEKPHNIKNIDEDIIRKGLADVKIPARFERINAQAAEALQTPFIIDGAHTQESISLCIETFCPLFGQSGILIFGCAADKDAAGMAKAAHRHFSKIIITTPGTFKKSEPEKVHEVFLKEAGEKKVSLIKDIKEAVKYALDYSNKNNLPILGTGSFYLVSEIRKIMFSN